MAHCSASIVVFTILALALQSESKLILPFMMTSNDYYIHTGQVCTQPIAITTSSDLCQAITLGSLRYTCSHIGLSFDWSSSAWSGLITVTTSDSLATPSLNVAGVNLTGSSSTSVISGETLCLSSTLTFTGNVTDLDEVTLTCEIGELTTNATIMIPGK